MEGVFANGAISAGFAAAVQGVASFIRNGGEGPSFLYSKDGLDYYEHDGRYDGAVAGSFGQVWDALDKVSENFKFGTTAKPNLGTVL